MEMKQSENSVLMGSDRGASVEEHMDIITGSLWRKVRTFQERQPDLLLTAINSLPFRSSVCDQSVQKINDQKYFSTCYHLSVFHQLRR